MATRYKLLIFDWDGTLMDSAQKIVDALSHAVEVSGAPARSDAQYRYIIGLGVKDALDYLFPNDDIDEDALRLAYRDYFATNANTPSPLFAGIKNMLATLKAQGYLLAVATGKNREGLNDVLSESGLSDVFDATRTADETASKPDPLMLNELMHTFGVKAQECLMIGDTHFDLDMASRVEMDSVAVLCGAHTKEELSTFKPVHVLEQTAQLCQWLAETEDD